MNVTMNSDAPALDYLARRHKLLIDGRWLDGQSGETIDVLDPATGLVVATVPAGGAADVGLAVAAARQAFEHGAWRKMPAEERGRVLWRFADLVDANADLLVDLEVSTNGMPRAAAAGMINRAAAWTRQFAAMSTRVFGRNASPSISSAAREFHAYSAPEPIGVVGLIVPWNGPSSLFVLKAGPALATGCSCVMKPAEDTPITALLLGDLLQQAGLPAGVMNIVTGYGSSAGAALVSHPDVDKISFTGSTATGKDIARVAADTLKRVTLELGGKSPCIVFDDADVETAIPAAAMAIFANTGQICFAGSRLYVQRKIFDKVIAGVTDFARSLKVGSGADPANNLGPLISAKQLSRVQSYIEFGREDGGEVLVGGGRQGTSGFFIEPTVFVNTPASSRIVREEIFGPVVVATPFDEVEEVIALANDTRYGLGAGIFTTSLSKAHRTASRLRAGNVWINCYGQMNPALPFCGFKEAGLGREMGEEGLNAYLEMKSVFAAL